MADVRPDGVKIGMLASGANIREVARLIKRHRLSSVVLDPVLKASTGQGLLEMEAVSTLRERLLPLVKVVTPNLAEAEALSGRKVRNLEEMERASREIKDMGPDVVITGGHLKGDAVDLVYDGKKIYRIRGSRIANVHDHGTGCVFSSAMAAYLSEGYGVPKAARFAHDFTRGAIEGGYLCGRGTGCVNPAQVSKVLFKKDRSH